MPVVSRFTREIVERIDEGVAYDDMFYLVCERARELVQKPGITMTRVERAFENDEEFAQLRVLFHTIPRVVLRMLALRTLPYELSNRESAKWGDVYSPDGPAACVIALSIQGRHGRGLTGKECGRLRGHLDTYAFACSTWGAKHLETDYGQSQLTPAEENALTIAMHIDNQYRETEKEWSDGDPFEKPRFCDSPATSAANIRLFCAVLARRAAREPDGDTPQESCPTYVSCTAKDLGGRTTRHTPDASSLGDTSPVWGLFVSAIAYIDLRPLVTRIPIIKCWDEPLVPLAEILVTVIGCSMATDDGLNIIQPGTSGRGTPYKNRDAFDACKREVYVFRPFFKENLRASLAAREAFAGLVDRMRANAKKIDGLLERERQLAADVDEAMAKADKAADRAEEVNKRGRALADRLREILDRTKGMFPE